MYGEMSKDTPQSKVKQQIDENLKRVYDASLNEDAVTRHDHIPRPITQR
jgi:hypothetical protein